MIHLHPLSTFPQKNHFDRLDPSTDLSFVWALTGEECQEAADGQVQAVIDASFTIPFPSTAICKGSPQRMLWQDKGQIVLNRKESLYFVFFQIIPSGWTCEEQIATGLSSGNLKLNSLDL